MKERGKAVDNGSNYSEFDYSCSSDIPCRKHPSSSSVGICAQCLKERLVKLVCSDCGEQRLSSCSCSDISSSYRNSCTVDVGSVGRISFLIENEKTDAQATHSKPRKVEKSDQGLILLRRSASSCVEVKRSNGFWKIKKLFRRKREKGCDFDDESEIWVSDAHKVVSRSRSLCSFRNGGFNDPDHDGFSSSDYAFSSAKISDVTGGMMLDSGRQSGFSESEPRKSGFRGILDVETGNDQFKGFRKGFAVDQLDRVQNVPNKSIFPVKEIDFSSMDESAFIDLKLDSSADYNKLEFPAFRVNGSSNHIGDHSFNAEENSDPGISIGHLKKSGLFGHGGSCRITVNEREVKFRSGSKSHKVWKWIFRHHSSGRRSSCERDENQILTS